MARRLALRVDGLNIPKPGRIPAGSEAVVMEAHDAAVTAGRSSYVDPSTRLTVFTARFLADRNYCCGSGCRHCPYVDP
jgi:hypothetical protein